MKMKSFTCCYYFCFSFDSFCSTSVTVYTPYVIIYAVRYYTRSTSLYTLYVSIYALRHVYTFRRYGSVTVIYAVHKRSLGATALKHGTCTVWHAQSLYIVIVCCALQYSYWLWSVNVIRKTILAKSIIRHRLLSWINLINYIY